MPTPVAPCKNCENRSVGCHGTCKDYLAFRSDTDKHRSDIREAKAKYYAYENWRRQVYQTHARTS